jgi:hypothetical protein
MASAARGLVGQFLEVGQGFHGTPIGAQVFLVAEVDDAREGSWRCRFVILA